MHKAVKTAQVLLFVAAAGVTGKGGGVLMLVAFLIGLVVTNTVVALTSTFGFLRAGRDSLAYTAVAVVTGTAGLALGTMYLFGLLG